MIHEEENGRRRRIIKSLNSSSPASTASTTTRVQTSSLRSGVNEVDRKNARTNARIMKRVDTKRSMIIESTDQIQSMEKESSRNRSQEAEKATRRGRERSSLEERKEGKEGRKERTKDRNETRGLIREERKEDRDRGREVQDVPALSRALIRSCRTLTKTGSRPLSAPPSLSCKHGGRREAFGKGSVRAGAGIIAGVGVVILVLGVIVRVVLSVVIAVVVVVVLAPILVPAPECAFTFATVPVLVLVEFKLEEPAAVGAARIPTNAERRTLRRIGARIAPAKGAQQTPTIPCNIKQKKDTRSTKVRVPEEPSERKEEKRDRDVIAPHTRQPPPKEHPVRITGLLMRRHTQAVVAIM
ncbi:hypothetical protein DFP72DRAFT_856013 [Ephemerocybe angulata]|uniref:Uncharacterized protein n=1 Tax=Ephemerocybe angulata TaxID=980116 RepID=A0A8H6HGD0_9AGAR|nr:hypothetical protein DFP72DRAFT_856013 [Tulosesus angulatus]